MTALLEVRDVSKTYRSGHDDVRAIGEVSFTVERGEFMVLVGPSGCGKTTLIKCISGLLPPTSGRIELH